MELDRPRRRSVWVPGGPLGPKPRRRRVGSGIDDVGALGGLPEEIPAVVTDTSVTYPGAVDGNDLVYTITPSGVLEQVVVKKAPAESTFRFSISTKGLSLTPNAYGGLEVVGEKGDPLGTISSSVAYDSSADAASDTAKYDLSVRADGSYDLGLAFDPGYFKTATYPVVIDPVLNQQVSPHRDGYVQQSTPTTNYESNVNLKVGSGLRSFLRFDMTNFSQSGRIVYDASLFLYPTATGGVTGGIAARRVTQTLPAFGTLNWNNQPNVGSNDLDVVSSANGGNGWWMWQLKELYQHIIDPSDLWNPHWDNNGVRLSASNAKTFYATEATGTADPVLYLSYNDLPNAFNLDTPPTNYVSETESPTLRANSLPSDPNNDDTLISFQISDDGVTWTGSHLIFQSPYDDKKSFTVPGGILIDGQDYWWRAVARDVCAQPDGLCSLTDGAGTVHTPTPSGVRKLTVSLKHHGDDPRYAMWSHDVGSGMTLKVNEANGNLFLDVPLDSYATPIGPLDVGLTYNHQASSDYGLGPGWDVAIGPRSGHGALPNRLYKLDTASSADVKIVFRGGRTIYFPHVDGNLYGATSATSGWVRKGSANWTYVDGDGGRYTFGLSAEQPEGARLKSAKPASASDAASGKSIDYLYNGSNQLTSVTDPLGRKITLQWAAGKLDTITASGGTEPTSFSPDPPFDTVWSMAYDGSGRLNAVDVLVMDQYSGNGDFQTVSFSYTTSAPVGKVNQIKDGRINAAGATGWQIGYAIDPTGLGRVQTITAPPGGASSSPTPWQFLYHQPFKGTTAAGACVTDPRGTGTLPTDCDAETDTDPYNQTQVEFSWAGLPIEIVTPMDENGQRHVSTYVFDDHLNLLCERDPVANVWGGKHCTSQTDSNGTYTDLDPDGYSTRYTYFAQAPYRLKTIKHPSPTTAAPRLQEAYSYDSTFTGLWAEVYEVSNLADLPNDEYVWTDFDQDWGTGNPPGANGGDSFSVRLTGYIDVADWSGPRTAKFRIWSSDGVSLSVAGSTILDCFGQTQSAANYNCGTNQDVKKTIWPPGSDLVPIEIEYSELTGSASLDVRWDGGDGGAFAVPAATRFQPNLGLVTTKTYQSVGATTSDVWEETWSFPTDDLKARRLYQDHHRRALPTGPDYVDRATYNSYGQPLTITEHYGTTEAATTTNVWRNGTPPWDPDWKVSCLERTTDPTGAVTDLQCNPAGDEIARTVSVSAVANQPAQTRNTFTYYDTLGRPTAVQGPSGETALSAYDLAGRVVQSKQEITAGVFAITDLAYDHAGHLLTETLPDPDRTGPLPRPVIAHTWDWADLERSRTDARGKVWNFDYDPLSRPTTSTSPLNAVTTTSYTLMDNPDLNDVVTYAPSGAHVTTSMDSLGRTLSEKLQTYAATTFAYDVMGNQTLVTDPAGIPTKQVFNNLSELTSRVEYFNTPSAATTTYTYDPAGRLQQVDGPLTSPDDRISYDYDAVGRLTFTQYEGVTLPSSATKASVSITYDAAGEQVRVAQPLTTATTMTRNWTYDVSGRTATSADARGTTTFTYNLAGWPTQVADPRPQTVHLGYDDLGRRICRHTAPCTQTTTGAETYAYDAAGNMTQANNAAVTFDMSYDDDGRLWKTFRNGSGTPETTYTYNPTTAQLTSVLDAAGTTSFTYNPAGQVATIDDPFVTGTPVSSYAYDATNGRLTTRTDAQANLRWERTYEPNTGRLDTQVIKNNTSGVTLASFDLGYDAADNVISKASSVFSNPANGTWGYSYDGASRLIQATGPNAAGTSTTYDYAYDGGGNRTLAKETTGLVVKNLTTTYDPAGLPMSATDSATGETATYAHDAIGNLTGIDSSIAANDWTFAYDAYSRTTCAVQGTSCASGSSRVLFTLDALDRAMTRVKGSSTTSLTYQGMGENLAKTVNGATTTAYLSTGSAGPLAEKTGSVSSFYLSDPHGDVVGLASTGAANQGTVSFDPWGSKIVTTGQSSFLGYQGDMTDPDTKQVDMGTRWYATGLGRFASRDSLFGSLSSPTTLNQHVYGGMNPVSMWDPTGMYQDDAGGGGGCGLSATAGCQAAVRANSAYYASHYSSYHGAGTSYQATASTTMSKRPPRPEPPSASVQFADTVGYVADAASTLVGGIAEQARWRLNESREIFRLAGAGFLEGRAVDSWLARADALASGALSRGGRMALRGAGGILTGLSAKFRYDELRAKYDRGTSVAGTALSVGAGTAAAAVSGALCSTGVGCLVVAVGAGLIATGATDAVFEWLAESPAPCGELGFKAFVTPRPACQ